MAIFDRIKYDGASNNESWLVYKADIENIALGSQLIVGMGQEAIFIKGGRAQDIFTPGTYTLQTGNLPLLRSVVGKAFGGNTPFTAEVVFVNTTNKLTMKWGTPAPINMKDPTGLILGLRARGTFAVKIDDTKIFVNQLIGTVHLNSGFNHDIIWEKFNPLINTKFQSKLMQLIMQRNISFLQVAAYYDEISKLTFNEIKQDFKDCGLELVNFFVESINAPQSDIKDFIEGNKERVFGEDNYKRERILKIVEESRDPEAIRMVVNSFLNNSNNSTVPSSQNNSNMITCPNCNKNIESGSRFCRYCGQPIPQQRFCSNCGQALTQGAMFCSNCGSRCQ